MGLFFASHAAVGFWKVLAVEIKSKKLKTPHAFHVFFQFGFIEVCVLEHSGCGNQFTKKVKTPHGFPLLYLIHSGVMCSGVLFGLIEVYGSGRSWL